MMRVKRKRWMGAKNENKRPRTKNSRKNTKRKMNVEKKNSRIGDKSKAYIVSMEREIEKNGYIYGRICELADYFGIPVSTFYKIIQWENFVVEKIKEGKNTYYFIMRKDILKDFRRLGCISLDKVLSEREGKEE